MRKIALVGAIGNFAMGSLATTFICRVAPNWVLSVNVGNVLILGMAFIYHVRTISRRQDQLSLPLNAIPRQPDSEER